MDESRASLGPRTAEAHRGYRLFGPVLTFGFATAVGVWTAWYLTHLPWLELKEQATIPALLFCWFVGMLAAGQSAGVRAAAGAGMLSAVLGLLILGSKITSPAAAGQGGASLAPNAALIVLGFLGLGLVMGIFGGSVGAFLARGRQERRVDWLARFAIVAAVAVVPLLFIGGMVTSTNSGMAVPDWPNTFGSNMFLYPLGPRTTPDVFLEHSHRLFGALLGYTTIVLTLWTLVAEPRRWVKVVAIVALVLVCVQGVVGGERVLQGNRLLAMVHGILAQLTFGLLVSLAIFLSPTFKKPIAAPVVPAPNGRRVRFFTTGTLHASILQLIFGAAYRHFRDNHSLWSHAGFSLVVLIMALLGGFMASAVPEDDAGIGRTLRRCGWALVTVVIVQFLLGWATFSLGGRGLQADSPGQAVLRTLHQANGGLLLGSAVLAFFWTRQLLRATRVHDPLAE